MTAEIRTATKLKRRSVRSAKMQFILTGFTQDTGFRVFAFERVGEDRTKYTVRADLALVLRYGIRLQELPLLCRSLLERRDNGEETSALTFTEDEMCLYAKDWLRKPTRQKDTWIHQQTAQPVVNERDLARVGIASSPIAHTPTSGSL